MKTKTPTPGEIKRAWYIVDAEGQPLGRMSSQIAAILRGKNKPYYVPNIDTGDYVIVINAAKVKVTGTKMLNKIYEEYSGYPGGLKQIPIADLLAKHPERIVQYAVRGMLPKNTLGKEMLKKLKVYAGAEHPHTAQKPEPLNLKYS
ncbi:MAG TPA: 50S ribosomal protein L13 [Candidatus Cloacimonadota bacterium]|nr:50S ribosomal protein L13 [Candidatus Cloacimonadota bacterium]HOV16492.1 50S ribosomal protein L13 [Candidatus Cloacimonadota bacterium]HQL15245.1 50S ribosomal protein L13 [Candidatus Cloacimonadota bacterium]